MYNPHLLADGLPPYEFRKDFDDVLEETITMMKTKALFEEAISIHFPKQNENNGNTTNGIEQLVD